MNASKNIWTPAAQAIFNLLNDLPVAYRANLTVALDGDPITALVLAQSFYFQCEAEGRGLSWWSKTDAEFSERLGLNVKRFRRGMDVLTDAGMALLSHRPRRYQCTDYQVNWARCHAYVAGRAHLWMPAQGELPIPKTGIDQYPKWDMANTQNGQSKEIKEEKEEKGVGDAPRQHPAILAFFEATGQKFWPQAGLIPIIIAKVGDDPKRVALWKEINIARLARGEMLMNIDKSLAWLEAGKTPDPAKVDGRKPNGRNGRGKSWRRPQVEYTEAQREEAQEKAREQVAKTESDPAKLRQRLANYQSRLQRGGDERSRAYWQQAVEHLQKQIQEIEVNR